MEMTANQGGKTVEERRPDHRNGDSMMAMMVMMMTMCFGVVLLFAVIPAIGQGSASSSAWLRGDAIPPLALHVPRVALTMHLHRLRPMASATALARSLSYRACGERPGEGSHLRDGGDLVDGGHGRARGPRLLLLQHELPAYLRVSRNGTQGDAHTRLDRARRCPHARDTAGRRSSPRRGRDHHHLGADPRPPVDDVGQVVVLHRYTRAVHRRLVVLPRRLDGDPNSLDHWWTS